MATPSLVHAPTTHNFDTFNRRKARHPFREVVQRLPKKAGVDGNAHRKMGKDAAAFVFRTTRGVTSAANVTAAEKSYAAAVGELATLTFANGQTRSNVLIQDVTDIVDFKVEGAGGFLDDPNVAYIVQADWHLVYTEALP